MGGRLSGPAHKLMAQLALLDILKCLSLIVAADAALHPHEVNIG